MIYTALPYTWYYTSGKKKLLFSVLVRRTMKEINTPAWLAKEPHSSHFRLIWISHRSRVNVSFCASKCLVGTVIPGQAAALPLPTKPDPKIPTNPVPLPTVKQQPEKSFKTKKKAEIHWQVQSDAISKGWLINPKIQGYLWNWSQTNCNYIA